MQQPGGKGPQNDHLRLVPAGNIGEKCSVGGFYLVRTAHPTAGGAVLRGFAAYLHPHFATAWVARPWSGAWKHEKSTGRIARAVGCAVRTMFFHAIACETDDHPWLVPAGNIGENCSIGRFCLVRTAHPTAGGAVLLGFAAICTPISQPHGWHDRGAVLQGMKNQQEGLRVR